MEENMHGKKKGVLITLGVILGIIAVAVVVCALPSKDASAMQKVSNKEDDRKVSRYEFAQLLCDEYGLDSDEEYEQFYEDVSPDNEYYEAVELAYAAGLLPETDKFNGSKKVTAEYAAVSSMKMLYGAQVKQIIDTDSDLTDDDYYEAAKEEGLVSGKSKKLTKGECTDLVSNVKEVFTQTAHSGKNYADIKYAQNVIEIPEEDVIGMNWDAYKLYISENQAENIEVGSVIVCTEPVFGNVVLGEVTAVQDVGGYLEVYIKQGNDTIEFVESADVQATQTVDIFYLYEYFSAEGMIAQEEGFDECGYTKGAFRNKTVSSDGFTITVKLDGNGAPSYEFRANDVDVSFTLTPRLFGSGEESWQWLAGSEFTVEMSNMEFGALYSCENGSDASNPDEMYVYGNYDISVQGELEAVEDRDECMDIEMFTVGVYAGAFSMNCSVSAKVGIEGKVEAAISVSNQQVGVSRKKGGVATNISRWGDEDAVSMDLTAESDVTFGAHTELYASFLNFPVGGAEISAGLGGEATKTEHSDANMNCIDLKVCAPVASGTFYAFGVKSEYELTTMDSALYRIDKHYEDKGYGYAKVDKCTYNQSAVSKALDKVNEVRLKPKQVIRYITAVKEKTTALSEIEGYRLEDWTTVSYSQSSGKLEAKASFNWIGFMAHYISLRNGKNSDTESSDGGLKLREFVELCVVAIQVCSDLQTSYDSGALAVGDTVHVYLKWHDADVDAINAELANDSTLKLRFASVAFDTEVKMK
jgi:hypothetical protein